MGELVTAQINPIDVCVFLCIVCIWRSSHVVQRNNSSGECVFQSEFQICSTLMIARDLRQTHIHISWSVSCVHKQTSSILTAEYSLLQRFLVATPSETSTAVVTTEKALSVKWRTTPHPWVCKFVRAFKLNATTRKTILNILYNICWFFDGTNIN